MERQRNWLGWAALALAAMALLVALGGRFGGPRMAYGFQQGMMAPQAPQAPQAPNFERGRGDQSFGFERGRGDQSFGFERGRGDQSFGFERGRGDHQGFGPAFQGRGDRHGFGPLGMIFGLFGALTKLAALGMLVWLLLRLFQQRRAATTPVPTTPAGHDPRVE